MGRGKKPRLSRSGRQARISARRVKEIGDSNNAIDAFMEVLEEAEAREGVIALDEAREPREMFVCPNCGKIDFNAIQEKKDVIAS